MSRTKRKAIQRGPGKESYKSVKALILTSQQISQPIIDLIESKFQGYAINKKNDLIIAAIKTLMRKYDIQSEEFNNKKLLDANENIVGVLTMYLGHLQKYGANFGSTEKTIDSILTATAVYSISDVELSKILMVSRKRIAKAKSRRRLFDDIVIKEEKKYENFNSDFSDDSNPESSHSESDRSSTYEKSRENELFYERESDTENENNVVIEEMKKEKKKSVFEGVLTPKVKVSFLLFTTVFNCLPPRFDAISTVNQLTHPSRTHSLNSGSH